MNVIKKIDTILTCHSLDWDTRIALTEISNYLERSRCESCKKNYHCDVPRAGIVVASCKEYVELTKEPE